MQTTPPSLVQGVHSPLEGVVVLGVEGAADGTGLAAGGADEGLDAGASGWAVGADAGADEAPGAKTPPPGLLGTLDAVGPLLGDDATGYEAGDDATGDSWEGVPWEGVEGVPADGLPICPFPAPILLIVEQPEPVTVELRSTCLRCLTF
jgi:hypothetical protein